MCVCVCVYLSVRVYIYIYIYNSLYGRTLKFQKSLVPSSLNFTGGTVGIQRIIICLREFAYLLGTS